MKNQIKKLVKLLFRPKRMLVIDLDALKNDEGYRYAWQANIAMAMKDEFDRWSKTICGRNATPDHIHEIANKGASNFIDNLTR